MATAIEQPPKSILQLRGCLATVTRNLASKHYRKDRQLKARESAAAEISAFQRARREPTWLGIGQTISGSDHPSGASNGNPMARCTRSIES